MLLFVTGMLCLALLFAPTLTPVPLHIVQFEHSSSSLLYFKNLRSFYYHITPDPKSRFVLYRLKRRNTDTTEVWLQFMIVSNPLMDESYIYAEFNTAGEQYAHPAVLFSRAQGDTLLPIRNLNNEGHYQLAAKVFNQLLANESMFLLNGKDTIQELYATKASNYATAIVLEDYFKLVQKL